MLNSTRLHVVVGKVFLVIDDTDSTGSRVKGIFIDKPSAQAFLKEYSTDIITGQPSIYFGGYVDDMDVYRQF